MRLSFAHDGLLGGYRRHALRNGCNVIRWKTEFAEYVLQARRIFRISFLWLRPFGKVEAQGRRCRSLQRSYENCFGTVSFQVRSGI